MKKRVIYGALFAILAIAMMVAGHAARVLFFLACGVISCYEMIRAFKILELYPPRWFVYSVFVACAALIAFGLEGYAFPAFTVLLAALFAQPIIGTRHSVKDTYAALGICAYPVCNLLLFMYIVGREDIWAAVILNSVLPSIVADTCALFGGKRFGKRKLAPKISPNKTVEGFLCGLAGGTLAGFAVHGLLVLFGRNVIPMWAELIGAFLASVFGALGDLAASMIKREAGIKDYGKLIPGHGGMMDRIDSALFAGPVVYMLYALFV